MRRCRPVSISCWFVTCQLNVNPFPKRRTLTISKSFFLQPTSRRLHCKSVVQQQQELLRSPALQMVRTTPTRTIHSHGTIVSICRDPYSEQPAPLATSLLARILWTSKTWLLAVARRHFISCRTTYLRSHP